MTRPLTTAEKDRRRIRKAALRNRHEKAADKSGILTSDLKLAAQVLRTVRTAGQMFITRPATKEAAYRRRRVARAMHARLYVKTKSWTLYLTPRGLELLDRIG